MGGACAFLIFLSIYLANNRIDDITIKSVQGRYFLPLLLLLPVFFKGNNETEAEQKWSGINWYIICSVGINIVAIFVQLQHLAIDYYG